MWDMVLVRARCSRAILFAIVDMLVFISVADRSYMLPTREMGSRSLMPDIAGFLQSEEFFNGQAVREYKYQYIWDCCFNHETAVFLFGSLSRVRVKIFGEANTLS